MTQSPFYEYVANLHVHTTFSDGSGTIQEVVAAAQKAGLQVLLTNDHDSLAVRQQGWEGYHDGLLVLGGMETSGPHHHYLAYGLDSVPPYDWARPQQIIDAVRDQGGVGFIAHPFEQGSPMSDNGHAFTWRDWSVTDFDGLCIWNYTSSWKTRARSWPKALYYFLFRSGPLMGPDPEVLAKWDTLGRSRRVAGIGGSDAHAQVVKLLGLLKVKIFPYRCLFQAVNTHLLLPEALTGRIEEDRPLVLKALAEGSCFVCHDRLRPGRGFDFWLNNGHERRAGQGREVRLAAGDCLSWRLPARARARLIRDGQAVLEMTASEGRLEVGRPGVYRLEAFILTRLFGWRPWIFSNPVYIRS